MATFKIKDDNGNLNEIDIDKLSFTDGDSTEISAEKKEAISKFLEAGNLDDLDDNSKNLLKDIKARIGSGNIPELAAAVLVRFDVSWVSIK
ncbi:hypothetical protein [Aureivirga sp. CE67]|uniref:hypothetical protein n=1 Tax=Aureivirga sp. CE67 TaxID=1788983 RepID=UPI0018CAD832|nr:hypothetical protein [Aureivirga sp. CE67]